MEMQNSRNNYIKECISLALVTLRIVGNYCWGWQKYDQENDDGIDGEIFIRDEFGNDTGEKIFVQIKCGSGYYRREDDNDIYIQPYSCKENLKKHLYLYKVQKFPVILIYFKLGEPSVIPNFLDIEAWWVRVDNYDVTEDSSYIKLPKKQSFDENSKEKLYNIVRKEKDNWDRCPLLFISKSERKFLSSDDKKPIRLKARDYYNNWKLKTVVWASHYKTPQVIISRIGWNQMTNIKHSSKRRVSSLHLLPIAEKILQTKNMKILLLKYDESNEEYTWFYALRARIDTSYYAKNGRKIQSGKIKKVQVIIKKKYTKKDKKYKYWFYTVDEIK